MIYSKKPLKIRYLLLIGPQNIFKTSVLFLETIPILSLGTTIKTLLLEFL